MCIISPSYVKTSLAESAGRPAFACEAGSLPRTTWRNFTHRKDCTTHSCTGRYESFMDNVAEVVYTIARGVSGARSISSARFDPR